MVYICRLNYSNEENQNSLEIYLNPADKLVNINHDGLKEIYTVLGEKLIETYENEINISNIAKGVYLVKVANKTMRLIKE